MSTATVVQTAVPLTEHRRSLKALTGIRFFAAVAVVVLHSRLPTAMIAQGHLLLGNFLLNGSLAVAMFFLLSGFILTYTYQGQLGETTAFRRFWEARFARIWPVYTASLFFSSAVGFGFPKISWMIATLLMVQAWDPFHPALWGAWNFVCWTLSTEAFFYLCFPWIQVRLERLNARKLQILFVALLVLIVSLDLSESVLGRGSYFQYLDIFPRPILRIPEFILGMTMGSYFLRRRLRPTDDVKRRFVVMPGVWTYGALISMVALMCRESGRWTSLVTATFAALIFGLATEETWFSRFLSTRLLILGGSISYSVYLMQNPVKALVKMIAGMIHVESSSFRMAAMIVLLFGISYGAFTLIEVPARDWLRAMFARTTGRTRNARLR